MFPAARIACVLSLLALLSACGAPRAPEPEVSSAALHPGETPELRVLVNKYADHYEVPRTLAHRVIQRESDYRPAARNGP